MKAVVVGAGFSGICSAYFLKQAGYEVEVFEKSSKSGGLIQTVATPQGHCEVAANGILNSALFESVAKEIGLDLIASSRDAKKRFIFRGRPRQWPLGLFESLKMLWRFFTTRNRLPMKDESVEAWGCRILGIQPCKYLLEPALQGIYAGDIRALSASLILKRFFLKKRKPKPAIRGLVAPRLGMGDFFEKMENYLKNRGVIFRYRSDFNFTAENQQILVVATGARAAAEIIKPMSENGSRLISSVEMLSLLKVTLFYPKVSKKIKGFGILFPRGQGVRSLGVLFNNFIFPASSTSESFILGGALDGGAIALSDSAVLEVIRRDRDLALNDRLAPEGFHIQRWPQTLPHYTLELEKTLENFEMERSLLEKRGVFLIGNYLGSIGLSQLFERASCLPQIVEEVKAGA